MGCFHVVDGAGERAARVADLYLGRSKGQHQIAKASGPIIGTILFSLLRETLAELGTSYLMVMGAVAIVVMLRAPKGIWA